MGFKYLPGQNIVDDDAELLVNTVNCVGVMGKGVALAFKTRWPGIMAPYKAECRMGLRPGACPIHRLPGGRHWAALATKDHWRDPSRIEWVGAGLAVLAGSAKVMGIKSIALPPPGCGNGGLDWRQVEPIVLAVLSGFDVRIYAEPATAAG